MGHVARAVFREPTGRFSSSCARPQLYVSNSFACLHVLILYLRMKNMVYWIFFLNTSVFLDTLYDPQRRLSIQPSLILAGLALASLMKSSEAGLGAKGREHSLWLRDAAQSALDASVSVGCLEPSLAQAAFVSTLRRASHYILTID